MIELDEFVNSLSKLEKLLNKRLNEEQQLIYWEKLNDIPGEALHDIIERMTDDLSPASKFPEPKTFRAAWLEWIDAHPDKIIKEKIHCAVCDNRGYFNVLFVPQWIRQRVIDAGNQIDSNKLWLTATYRGVVNCGHCHAAPFAAKIVPEYTIEQIEDMDWVRVCG